LKVPNLDTANHHPLWFPRPPIRPRIAEAAALVGEELSSFFDIAASQLRAAAERKGVAFNAVSEI
jgi:hypothetical protein